MKTASMIGIAVTLTMAGIELAIPGHVVSDGSHLYEWFYIFGDIFVGIVGLVLMVKEIRKP